MNRTLKARYEDGVLHPLDALDIPEGLTVEIAIVPAAWGERMNALLERARIAGLTADEVEITRTAEEVRTERRVSG